MGDEWADVLRADMPRLAAFIDTRYRSLAFIDVPETRGVEVFVDKLRPSARVDPETGWPCFVR
jgi:hypothetical protein